MGQPGEAENLAVRALREVVDVSICVTQGSSLARRRPLDYSFCFLH